MHTTGVDFAKITDGMTTKSDKIRALGRAGVPTAEIARYLDIRYQFARNVLVESGLRRSPPAKDDTAKQAPQVWAQVGADGMLSVPAGLLAQAGLGPGQRALMAVSGDGIEILSQSAALARVKAIASRYLSPDAALVDELIAERRAEAGAGGRDA